MRCSAPSARAGKHGLVNYHGPGKRTLTRRLDVNERLQALSCGRLSLRSWVDKTVALSEGSGAIL